MILVSVSYAEIPSFYVVLHVSKICGLKKENTTEHGIEIFLMKPKNLLALEIHMTEVPAISINLLLL